MRHSLFSLVLLTAAAFTSAAQNAALLRADRPGATIPPTMYGIFFEDINFGADGGLYAEMVKNRSFEFAGPLSGWKAAGNVDVLDTGGPFGRNPHYVRLSPSGHRNKYSSLENEGFFGITFRQDSLYRFSAYMRAPQGSGRIKVELCDPASQGESQIMASAVIDVDSPEWRKYTAELRPAESVDKGVLRVTLAHPDLNAVDIEHVSLFPAATWKGREGGLRADLAQALADLRPGVFRFPGGCIVEGTEIHDRYQWKNTVGPVENRPVNINRWQFEFPHRFYPDYYQSYGLGFYEYFQLAEDIGAEPLPVLNVGMVCQYENPDPKVQVPVDSLQPYIDDALDLIEFANGPVDSQWGAIRAEMGHPAPFNLRMIAIGNEQWGPEYVERLEPFVKALRDRHPEIKIIGSSGPNSEGKDFDYLWPEMRRLGVDLVDEHFYRNEDWFLSQGTRYDKYPRKGPKVFAGEYACHGKGKKWNHYYTSLLEAAFMTGLERNADVVEMATYAPLFAHIDGWQWRPDMIWFDNSRLMKSSSYYVQQLYGLNRGERVLPLTLDGHPIAGLEGQRGLFASAVTDGGDIVVKVANTSAEPQEFALDIKGIASNSPMKTLTVTRMTSPDLDDENSLDRPDLIKPVTSRERIDVTKSWSTTLPPYSFTIYRFSSEEKSNAKGRFEAGNGTFLLSGEPFVVKAAELHYPRIPREYWDHRIKQCKALGMNTICLYTFWNAHEPKPDRFDFTGQNNLREFVKLCQANDMKVILRPGPYVCAEWEMGGLPWWLLKKKDIRLRETDTYFLERVDKFQKAVAAQVGDLTVADGGPIIMVQVENEYGSYGTDKPYVAAIRDMLRRNFGPDVTLFQCDWSSNFLNNGLDDLIWTMNFGTGANIDQQFAGLREVRPQSPLMCSEFWSGWFDKWGANHETRPASDMIAGIDEMLSKGISFSLYMTHGGTNWGHWAGANSPGFAPDVTSYDYDAPISESGQLTPKYRELRNTLAKYNGGRKLPPVPASIKPVSIPKFTFTEVAPLWDNLPAAKHDTEIRTMEEYDQGFGSILYSTTLPELTAPAVLTVRDPHDFAQIFVDGRYIGKLDRRNGEKELTIPACPKGARLDILVEAMGRINFGRAIKDFKGITDEVTLTEERDGHKFVCRLRDWQVFNIEDAYETYTAMNYRPLTDADKTAGRYPLGAYRATFRVDKPSDTFLDFESWGKGLVYVNGHPMGRIWEIGPQQTLYMPGCWLKKGDNEIIVFDILGPKETVSEGLREPKLDRLLVKKRSVNREPGQELDLSSEKPVAVGSFKPGNGWQDVTFAAPVRGRYVCIEALDAIDGKDMAAIAEMYLLDGDGERLSREPWTVMYADSEDTAANRTADKTFDLQESTYWQTASGSPFPHAIVIDLGAEHTLTGFQYLPRMEAEVPGAVGRFNIYVKPTNFKY